MAEPAPVRFPAPRSGLVRCAFGALIALCAATAFPTAAQSAPGGPARRDGGRDFDFEIGRWKTELRRLKAPLTGSSEWTAYSGTTTVTPIWGGRANLVELDVAGPGGRLQALSLRLYDPETAEWSLNFTSSAGGTLAIPSVGRFGDGRGEFYNQETIAGRTVIVRFVISDIKKNSVRFEQAFSPDGGRSWETNWIATDTRLP